MSEASFAEQLKKRRIGAQGYKQRQSAESAAEPAQAAFSHLARHLLEEYSWGGISAHQVQQISNMARLDGLHHRDTDKLASFGTYGRHPNHIDRDLRKYMESYLPFELPSADGIELPLKALKGKDQGLSIIACLNFLM